jgi:glycosyltransferase involved in cell wall biosynthesis
LKIVQLLPVISYGDAVGNDTLALDDLLKSMGYKTSIYAESIDERVAEHHPILPVKKLPKLNEDDVLIYHLCVGFSFYKKLHKLKCRKIAIYHNVTPAFFFKEYSLLYYHACKQGIDEVKQLKGVFDYCLADSEYNRKDLISHGYRCPIDIRPILVPFDDYNKTPDKVILDRYNDGKTNILYIGRVAPNKRHEDIIAAFSCYKKYYDTDARLFLVGDNVIALYQSRLDEYVKKLGVKDVYFTGKVSFNEILAYYKVSDVFLCMSEHEGFCVPLIEAMYFDIPVIAYSCAAVPETMSGAGVLLQEKDPLETAGVINKAVTDTTLRSEIIKGQQKRLTDFSYEKTSALFLSYLSRFIQGEQV